MGDESSGLASPQRSLWDKAYDALALEDEDLIRKYEDLLLKKLLKDDVHNPQAKTIDSLSRREKLDMISTLGLKRIEQNRIKVSLAGHSVNLQDALAKAARAAKGMMHYAKDAVGDVPYASIIIAGVSLVLPLLTNPSMADVDNQYGFTHVTSKMAFYMSLEPMLLGEETKAPGLRQSLEPCLVTFYTKIIDFQMRTVLRFFRGRLKNFFRGSVDYDKWTNKTQSIIDEGNDLASKIKTALSAHAIVKQVHMGEKIDVLTQTVGEHFDSADDRACLRDLKTTNPSSDKTRIEGSRGGLLADAYRWVLENKSFIDWQGSEESKMLWVRGNPGKGKTMILCGLIDELQTQLLNKARGPILAYFFCQATNDDINSSTAVLRGLLFMIVAQQPKLMRHLRKPYDREGARLFTDANAWSSLKKIFFTMLDDMDPTQTLYLVVDALDECGDASFSDGQLAELLSFLVDVVSAAKMRVKCIVSSRNWRAVEEGMHQTDGHGTLVPLNLEVNEESVSAAVAMYIRYKVDELVRVKGYDDETKQHVSRHLHTNSEGTFLWVALVCQCLASPQVARRHARDTLEEFPPGLGPLYERMLLGVEKAVRDRDVCFQLLAFVSLVTRPLTLLELMALVRQFQPSVGEVQDDHADIVLACGSFLTLRDNIVYWVHQSARDFFNGDAVAARLFPTGVRQEHGKLFRAALDNLQHALRRNVADLPGLSSGAEDVKTPAALTSVQYSTVSWAEHFLSSLASNDGPLSMEDANLLRIFFRRRFLNWLEALGILGGVTSGILALRRLRGLSDGVNEELQVFLADAYRFLLFSQAGIAAAPLQVYASALVFCPKHGAVYQAFKDQAPGWALMAISRPVEWGSYLYSLEGHDGLVTSVAFSPNGKYIASGSNQKVRIWDVALGHCLHTLEGHRGDVSSIAFSPPDTGYIASGSSDETIRIWNGTSGKYMYSLYGHTGGVTSIAFLPNGKHLASISTDNIVKVWDVASKSGVCKYSLAGDEGGSFLAFSSDGSTWASYLPQGGIRLRSTTSGTCTSTLNEDRDMRIWACAFSPDSKHAAMTTILNDYIEIWDVASGKMTATLVGHDNRTDSIAFSSDSTRVAAASCDNTLKIWNVKTGTCTHTSMVLFPGSMAFSADSVLLASVSFDRVNILDTTVDVTQLETEKGGPGQQYANSFQSMVSSPNGKYAASVSLDGVVRLWESENGNCKQVLPRSSNFISDVAFSSDGTRFATGSYDGAVQIRDVESGVLVSSLQGPDALISCIAFSFNGRYIAVGYSDNQAGIWDIAREHHTKLLTDGRSDEKVNCIVFSPNDRYVVTGHSRGNVHVWDATSARCLHKVSSHIVGISELALTPDGTCVVGCSFNGSAKVWNLVSGMCTHTFKGYFFMKQAASLAQSLEAMASLDENDEADMGLQLQKINPNSPLISLDLKGGYVWLFYKGEKVLWLPADFRPESWDLHGQTLSIITSSSRVYFLTITTMESALGAGSG